MAFSVVNDSYGASLTQVSLNKSNIPVGETVTLDFTLKISSSAEGGAVSGNIEISLAPSGSSSYMPVYTISGASIALGKSKSYSVEINFNPTTLADVYDIQIFADNSDGFYVLKITNALTRIAERQAPVILDSLLTDGHNALVGFAQNFSELKFYSNAQLDSQDPLLTAVHYIRIYSGSTTLFSTKVANGNGNYLVEVNDPVYGTVYNEYDTYAYLGVVAYSGTFYCDHYVVDSAGMQSQTVTTKFVVQEYTKPTFTTMTAQRYIISYDDDGNEIIEDSTTGTNVRFTVGYFVEEMRSMDVDVSQYPNGVCNAYSLAIRYDGSNDSSGESTIFTAKETDFSSLININTVEYFPGVVFSEKADYTFEFILTDLFTNTQKTIIVNQVTAILNAEKTGVSVGMMSTGKVRDKKFEVSEDYRTFFYGKIAQLGAGWQTLTPESGVTTPSDSDGVVYGGGQLRCRRIENKCIIDGSVQVKPGSSSVLLAKLPDGYTPPYSVYSFNACSGARIARIAVGGYETSQDTAGYLYLTWVRNLSDGSLYTTSTWVQCSIEYWVEDEEVVIDDTVAIVGEAILGKMILGKE